MFDPVADDFSFWSIKTERFAVKCLYQLWRGVNLKLEIYNSVVFALFRLPVTQCAPRNCANGARVLKTDNQTYTVECVVNTQQLFKITRMGQMGVRI